MSITERAKIPKLSILKKEVGVAEFVPYTSHVTENIVKTAAGDFVFCVRLSGAPHQSANISVVNGWHTQLNGFLRNIASPHAAIWSHVVRREYNEFPKGEFEEGFVNDINEKYKNKIEHSVLFINELYISVVYRPETLKAGKFLEEFFNKDKSAAKNSQDAALEEIDDLISTLLAALDTYEPQLLGMYEHRNVMFSEVCEFLAYLINGEWRRVALPRAEIRNAIPSARPFFGKGGLLTLVGPTRTTYGTMVGIQEYPSVTFPGFLDELLGLPFEFTLSQSFNFLSKAVAKGRMARQKGRLVNSGDVAASQIQAIDDALDNLTSNEFVMGTHSLCLHIKSESEADLKSCISMAGAALSDVGIKWTKEDAGAAAAFWSMLPANFIYRIRMGDTTSLNFAGFASMHNYPVGRLTGNQWGDAVTIFESSSGGPFYFSFHKSEEGMDAKRAAALDPNHKELANTIVIGMSGAGKTVLETFLLAQVQKFNQPPHKPLTSILFDKDLGASVAVRAMGGKYYPLKNGVPSGFNPFQLKNTPSLQTFLEQLIGHLVTRHGEPITATDVRELSNAIRSVLNSDDASTRRLSSVLQLLDPTAPNGVHTRLQRWCWGGALGWLLDNPEDTLSLDDSPIVGFDVTEFLDNNETRTPTFLYLMYRVQSLFDGRRVVLFMDEFWKILDDPAFEDFVKNKLVTIRKQDGILVMFTQAPEQITQSEIAFSIIQQTATKIFLPNESANRDSYINDFKLSEQEFKLVASLHKSSRKFLVKQGQNSAVCSLNLKGFDDDLAVLSGNTGTSLLVESLIEQYGDEPEVWLPIFHQERKTRILNAQSTKGI